MPPQPKRKYSRARKGERRSHIAAAVPALVTCPQCNSSMLPHHVCPTCGSYNGRDVVKIKSPKPKVA